MQTKFKRHQEVRLLVDPNPEYVEYEEEFDNEQPRIRKGMIGKVNVILPNGEYHVAVLDDETGKTIAYVPMVEDYLEAV